MSRFTNPVPQFFLNNGAIASSGKFKFYENNNFSVLKNTYSQSNNTIANTNPVTLDGQGRMPPCFGTGLYSVRFYAYDNAAVDRLGVLQWERSDVNLSELTGQFAVWSPLVTYLLGDAVKGSNGSYYKLFVATSAGNDPISSPTFWEKVVFITKYNANRTYLANDIVEEGGKLYSSIAGSTGNTPPSSAWTNLTFNNSIVGAFSATGAITGGSFVTAGSLTAATVTASGVVSALSFAATAGATFGNAAQAGTTILDWYEEGTFTPVVVGTASAGTAAYSVQSGRYTRVGNIVFLSISLTWTGHTGAGNLRINTLPFAASAVTENILAADYSNLLVGAGLQLSAFVGAGPSVFLNACDPAGTAKALVQIDAAATINVTGCYFV